MPLLKPSHFIDLVTVVAKAYSGVESPWEVKERSATAANREIKKEIMMVGE